MIDTQLQQKAWATAVSFSPLALLTLLAITLQWLLNDREQTENDRMFKD